MFIDTDLKFEKPVLEVQVDDKKAATMGITMDNIGSALAVLLGGNYINRFSIYGQSYKVIPKVFHVFRYNPHDIQNYYITTSTGDSVPLSSVINLDITTQANELYHFQQLNSATLSAVMMPGEKYH